MKVSDTFAAYFSAVKLNATLNSEEAIDNHIRDNPLRFSYGDVTYSTYKAKYNPEKWIQRKFVAIPAALYAGVVKSVCHLAIAFFHCIPKGPFNRHFNADIFRIARDMEEALGWLITFFNDKSGSYLVQESLFQKECYNSFEEMQRTTHVGSSQTIPLTIPTQQPIVPQPASEEMNVSIEEQLIETVSGALTEMTPHEIKVEEEVLKTFNFIEEQLKEMVLGTLTEMTPHEINVGEEVLKAFNLDESSHLETPELNYDTLSDEEFQKLTVRDLKSATLSQIRSISERIGNARESLPDENFNSNVLECPISDFHKIPGEKISEVIHEIPVSVLALITDKQIEKLNLKKATEETINGLFYYIDGKEEKRRFALLPFDQVQANLYKLGAFQLELISDSRLMKLTLKDAPAKTLKMLFGKLNPDENQSRFVHLTPDQIQDYITKHRNENIRRFELLSAEQVQECIERLDNDELSLITENQLKGLYLQDISLPTLHKLFSTFVGEEGKRRFAPLKEDRVQPILKHLDKHELSLISDNQLKELDLRVMSPTGLDMLFSYTDGEEGKRRFALIKEDNDKIQPLLDKLGRYQLQQISGACLKELDLTNLSREKIDLLFPSFSPNSIREEFQEGNFGFFEPYNDGQHVITVGQTELSEEEVSRISEEIKKRNAEKLNLLEPHQLTSIRHKLIPINLGLISGDTK